MVSKHIAVDGYPYSEALYMNIHQYEMATGEDFWQEFFLYSQKKDEE